MDFSSTAKPKADAKPKKAAANKPAQKKPAAKKPAPKKKTGSGSEDDFFAPKAKKVTASQRLCFHFAARAAWERCFGWDFPRPF